MPEVKDQIQTLFEKMLSGDLNAAERMSLNKVIQSSDEAKEYYLELCQMNAMLADEHGAFAADLGSTTKNTETSNAKIRKPPIIQFILTLAALLGITFLGVKLSTGKEKSDHLPYRGDLVATISENIGAEFEYVDSQKSQLSEGDQLYEGIYKLNKGIIEVTYSNGAKLVIESPAEVEFFNNNSINLHEGKVSATVPQTASGYTIKGLGVSIVDIGTEFSAYVKPGKYLETHVFDGLVELQMHYETEDVKHRLRAGQAARVMMGTAGPVMAGIDLRSDFFIRHIHESESHYRE